MENVEEKEKIKNKLQETVQELNKLMKLKEPILINWNDDIAKMFDTKYKKIERQIEEIAKEIEELQKLL
jgi:predicted translin family RNA/ssDNA-binding protein